MTLGRGGRVYADLAWEDGGNPAQVDRVAYLRVWAPGAVHFLTVRFAALVNGGGLTGTAFAAHPEVAE